MFELKKTKQIQLGNGAVALFGVVAVTGAPVLTKPVNLNNPAAVWILRLAA